MQHIEEPDVEKKMDGYDIRRLNIRLQILNATAEFIRESGDINTSVRDIARRAGVSQATPFNHFGSKEGIFSEIVKRSVMNLYRDQSKHSSSKRSVRKLFTDMSQFYVDDEALYRPILRVVLPGSSEANGAFKLAVQSIRKALEQSVKAGEIENWVNIEVFAEQLETFWLGTLVLWTRQSITSRDWVNRVDHGISLMLKCGCTSSNTASIKRDLGMKQREIEVLI